jgi:hypothetical protein
VLPANPGATTWLGDGPGITSAMSTFYEQVTVVKLLFFLHRTFVVGLVAAHVALHRVSIRTLDELS